MLLRKKCQLEKPNAFWLAKLPQMSVKIEYEVFLDSPNEEQYSDLSTLPRRLQNIVNEVVKEGRVFRSEGEPEKKNDLTRIGECLLMYADAMSHSVACKTIGHCYVNIQCQGMKHVITEHAECSIDGCKTCKMLTTIRDLTSKIEM